LERPIPTSSLIRYPFCPCHEFYSIKAHLTRKGIIFVPTDRSTDSVGAGGMRAV
jgi:hypothetical protein